MVGKNIETQFSLFELSKHCLKASTIEVVDATASNTGSLISDNEFSLIIFNEWIACAI